MLYRGSSPRAGLAAAAAATCDMTDDDRTGTDAGTTDEITELNQTLDTAMYRSRTQRLQGRIDQRLKDTFESRAQEVEKDSSRFQRAIDEGWNMHYSVATSGAHGWQIESDDGLQLADNAYPEDVSWLVFDNGWIHRTGARWLKDDDLAEWVAGVQDRRETASDRIATQRREAFEADDRLEYDTDVAGHEMPGWWRFQPTGFVGRPEAAVAHAAGYDAHRTEGGSGE